ncbi:hypothetical protein Dsin_013424 [Dipteronia sinensis]|uniref:Uncharacterized protein n=1 Tax=Dipteronia sinensis TaxID=43782 RepID=A0AAE0AL70_9ROSI|nr:hypothetical protein Dsin_013424 [Dipteronia sinensis]
MEATSNSTTNINGVLIKFKNRRCLYGGVKAVVKISESQNNSHKLYFVCEKGKCKFYSFWSPYNEEFNLGQFSDSVSQRNGGREAGDVVGKGAVLRKLLWKN